MTFVFKPSTKACHCRVEVNEHDDVLLVTISITSICIVIIEEMLIGWLVFVWVERVMHMILVFSTTVNGWECGLCGGKMVSSVIRRFLLFNKEGTIL